ncbi:MAG: YIP1 family protein [Sporomusaceae bacterium]|nr:YIP1 family protein [Sporomusaceae bacterium]
MDEEERRAGKEPGTGRQPETLPDINPWRDIFFRPRATTRWLLTKETAESAQTMWFSFTALFIVMLFLAVMFKPGNGDGAVTKMQLVIFTPLIFMLSWVYYIVESYLLCALSRLMGGRCEVWEMRVVNAFTTAIPGVFMGFVQLGVFIFFDRKGLVTTLVDNVVLVWSSYITLGAIAAAAGIPAWRALVVYMASAGLWLAGFWIASLLLPGVAGLLAK